MNIYVGNLPRTLTDSELRQAFETYGQVASAKIITDKFSGQSRGFGFVEMPTESEAREAIKGLDGNDLKGQALNVNEARPRQEGRRGGGRPGGGPRRGGHQGGGRFR
jgi:RNA recognition motif-containing protein